MSYKIVNSEELDANLTNIANAIREKTGKTDSLTLEQMPEEISAIETGGDFEQGFEVGKTETLSKLEPLTATENGEYMPDVGYSKVTVDYQLFKDIIRGSVNLNIKAKDLEGITAISSYAFYEKGRLISIELPDSVKQISGYAFTGCGGLKKLKLGKNVQIIQGSSMKNSGIQVLILEGDFVKNMQNYTALQGTPIAEKTGYIYVPDNLVEAYKTATNWSTYASQIKPISELPEGV